MRSEILSKANALWYVGALICFFLPFFEFSCQGHEGERQKFAQSTGMQVVGDQFTVTDPGQAEMWEKARGDSPVFSATARVLTILAFFVLAVGAMLLFLESSFAKTIACIAGFTAAFLLISMALGETGPMETSYLTDEMPVISLMYGWWLATGLSLFGGVMTFRLRESGTGEMIARWIGASVHPGPIRP